MKILIKSLKRDLMALAHILHGHMNMVDFWKQFLSHPLTIFKALKLGLKFEIVGVAWHHNYYATSLNFGIFFF